MSDAGDEIPLCGRVSVVKREVYRTWTAGTGTILGGEEGDGFAGGHGARLSDSPSLGMVMLLRTARQAGTQSRCPVQT